MPDSDDESTDADSLPEMPDFDLHLPWFKTVAGFEGVRKPVTRTKCVVKVSEYTTVGELRKKVRDATDLTHFRLVIDGVELVETKEKGSDDEEEEEEHEDDPEALAAKEEAAMAALLMVGEEKERMEREAAEAARLAEEMKNSPQGEARSLGSLGVKTPPPPLEKKPEVLDKKGKKKKGLPDASFLVRVRPKAPQADVKGEDGDGGGEDDDGDGEGGADEGGEGGEGGAGGAEEKAEVASKVVEIEEIDIPLDAAFFVQEESSAELLRRAINAANLRWWERAADGNVAFVKELWAKAQRKDLLKVNWRNPDAHDRTAVMACAFRGQYHTLRWLVTEKKARVNGWDDLGCTALNLACRGGYPKVVKYLLEAGAKADVADNNGWTAAMWALAMGHLEVIQTMADLGVPMADLGSPAPFASGFMSATTLLPLPAIRYKADQARARAATEASEMRARASAHATRMEELRVAKEAELLGAQEKMKADKVAQYRHRYMRDARENWGRHEEQRKAGEPVE